MSPAAAKAPPGPLVLSIVVTTVGIGWLLSAMGYGRDINWVWTLGLGVAGVLTFVLSGGVDKASVVIGPFFLISSCLSILRQTGKIDTEIELPVLVILIGILLFISQLRVIPIPPWYTPLPGEGDTGKGS